jgi:hypothetical protein
MAEEIKQAVILPDFEEGQGLERAIVWLHRAACQLDQIEYHAPARCVEAMAGKLALVLRTINPEEFAPR